MYALATSTFKAVRRATKKVAGKNEHQRRVRKKLGPSRQKVHLCLEFIEPRKPGNNLQHLDCIPIIRRKREETTLNLAARSKDLLILLSFVGPSMV